jgi:hypothetical protein
VSRHKYFGIFVHFPDADLTERAMNAFASLIAKERKERTKQNTTSTLVFTRKMLKRKLKQVTEEEEQWNDFQEVLKESPSNTTNAALLTSDGFFDSEE